MRPAPVCLITLQKRSGSNIWAMSLIARRARTCRAQKNRSKCCLCEILRLLHPVDFPVPYPLLAVLRNLRSWAYSNAYAGIVRYVIYNVRGEIKTNRRTHELRTQP
jgi:hypothetical protein